MKSFFGLLAAAALVSAKEMPKNEEAAAKYDSGEVMGKMMERKMAFWAKEEESGDFNQSNYPPLGHVPCVEGYATAIEGDSNHTFACQNLDLYSFLSHADLGSWKVWGSSSWGWVSEDGREFAIIGQGDGTAFAEITPEGQLVYLGRLPQQSLVSQWREIRTYKHYAVIGSEAYGHGIQVFDLHKLLDLDAANPRNFSIHTDLTGHFRGLPVGRTHNVNVNEELDYVVAVGAQPRNDSCAAGLIYLDMKNIENGEIESPGCASSDGYVHDAECLVYRGPDTRYDGRDICYSYNEDTLTIYDATDKIGNNASKIISITSYEGASYTHQGAVLDREWQEFIILDDELDEEEAAGPAADSIPVTYIFDIRDLENPKQTGIYKANHKGIDHNQYVFDGLAYQSNYGGGLRVYDVSSIPNDPTGAGVSEVAFFDIYPEDDEIGGVVDFVGTWSHYAGYPSGYVMINTIERGVFVVKNSQFEKRARGQHYKKPRRV